MFPTACKALHIVDRAQRFLSTHSSVGEVRCAASSFQLGERTIPERRVKGTAEKKLTDCVFGRNKEIRKLSAGKASDLR